MSLLLPTILKLKKTLSSETLSPMGWREIGKRMGMSAMGAKYHARKLKHRCPTCLQALNKQDQ